VAPVPAARQRFPGLGPAGRGAAAGPGARQRGSVGERLWRRLAGHLGGQRWRLCALRLHAADDGRTLAASLSTLSSLGAATARRIARLEGAEGELAIDDCCCADAARRRRRGFPATCR
jgi:hypothetical protein